MIFVLAYADDVFGSYLIERVRQYGEKQHKHDWFICIKIQINTITSVQVYKQNKLVLSGKNKNRNPLELQSDAPFDQQIYRRLVISADSLIVFQTGTIGPDYARRLFNGICEAGNESLCCLKLEAERVKQLLPVNHIVSIPPALPNITLTSEPFVVSQSLDTVRLPTEGRTLMFPQEYEDLSIPVILDWVRGHIRIANINPISENVSRQLLQQGRELAPIVSDLQRARSQYNFDDSLEKAVNDKYRVLQNLWTKIMQDSKI